LYASVRFTSLRRNMVHLEISHLKIYRRKFLTYSHKLLNKNSNCECLIATTLTSQTYGRTQSAYVLTHHCSQKHVFIRLSLIRLQRNGSFKVRLFTPGETKELKNKSTQLSIRPQCQLHTYIHAYMHTCIHAYIHTYIHTYIYIYAVTFQTRLERVYCITQQTKLPVMLCEV
jgi:hypothetical protein